MDFHKQIYVPFYLVHNKTFSLTFFCPLRETNSVHQIVQSIYLLDVSIFESTLILREQKLFLSKNGL